MRYWWVNQNKTFSQESEGGYLWSPKRKSNGQRNPFYEFMREVAPGDIIFSFSDTLIPAIGIAQSTAYPSPKPAEFGSTGPNWSTVGWKVAVRYFLLSSRIRPADHMHRIGSMMPDKYAPLQPSGRGNQGVYLTSVPDVLARELIRLIGSEASNLLNANAVRDEVVPLVADPLPDVIEWEDYISAQIQNDRSLGETERSSIVVARRGQGLFKRKVQEIEAGCRVTGVERVEHLIASHCKPWRDCETNKERLDGENGLLLTPSIDHLFDRGYISFEDKGELLISPVAHRESLRRMGIEVDARLNVGAFSSGQAKYLDFHREQVFLEANV